MTYKGFVDYSRNTHKQGAERQNLTMIILLNSGGEDVLLVQSFSKHVHFVELDI